MPWRPSRRAPPSKESQMDDRGYWDEMDPTTATEIAIATVVVIVILAAAAVVIAGVALAAKAAFEAIESFVR